jgi:F0F1-type ATP synthase membrane subunit b/b'
VFIYCCVTDTRNHEIASQRRELQNVFEKAKQELLQTLEESKAALRREVEILVQTVALTLESDKAKGDPSMFSF